MNNQILQSYFEYVCTSIFVNPRALAVVSICFFCVAELDNPVILEFGYF